jgi:ABC-type phosphate/phosphonate transport system permease subunit
MSLLSMFLGLVARVAIPFLAKRRKNPDQAKWEWKFIWPQLLSFLMVVLVLPLVVSDLSGIWTMQYQAAWILGWGAADLGRQVYKALETEDESSKW